MLCLLQRTLRDWRGSERLGSFWLMSSGGGGGECPECSQVGATWTAVYKAVIGKVGFAQVIWPMCLMAQPRASASNLPLAGSQNQTAWTCVTAPAITSCAACHWILTCFPFIPNSKGVLGDKILFVVVLCFFHCWTLFCVCDGPYQKQDLLLSHKLACSLDFCRPHRSSVRLFALASWGA